MGCPHNVRTLPGCLYIPFRKGTRVRWSDNRIESVYTGDDVQDENTRQELRHERGTVISVDDQYRLADVRWDGEDRIRRCAYGNIKQW